MPVGENRKYEGIIGSGRNGTVQKGILCRAWEDTKEWDNYESGCKYIGESFWKYESWPGIQSKDNVTASAWYYIIFCSAKSVITHNGRRNRERLQGRFMVWSQ